MSHHCQLTPINSQLLHFGICEIAKLSFRSAVLAGYKIIRQTRRICLVTAVAARKPANGSYRDILFDLKSTHTHVRAERKRPFNTEATV
jgi:hypothetical protein